MGQINEDPILCYHTAVRLEERDLTLLFQRVNFFLISTAFLIGAEATLVVAGKHIAEIEVFASIINATGLLLSIVFFVTNYISARMCDGLFEYIRKIEMDKEVLSPYFLLDESARKLQSVQGILKDFFRTLKDSRCNPMKMTSTPHTWLLPGVFIIVWMMVWIGVL